MIRIPMSSAERQRDRGRKAALGFTGHVPKSRWLLGNCRARDHFAEGESFTVNVYEVTSRFVGRTRFCQPAKQAGPSTMYRIRVTPK